MHSLARVLKHSYLGLIALIAISLSACGFHLPNQTKLGQALPELIVIGDFHHEYFKLVVNRLRASGVKVTAQESGFVPKQDRNIPLLTLPAPMIVEQVVSVDSFSQAIETSLKVSTAATLTIPNHRPLVMNNSITRSVLNKPGQSLASDNEKVVVLSETFEQLSYDLVLRLSYLGRSSDPDTKNPQPSELLQAKDEYDPIIAEQQPQMSGLTLLEALQMQDQYEYGQAKNMSLDELNNGNKVLDSSNYKLPPVKPKPLHQAPEHLY